MNAEREDEINARREFFLSRKNIRVVSFFLERIEERKNVHSYTYIYEAFHKFG